MVGGFFTSDSKTNQSTEVEDRTNTSVASGSGSRSSNSSFGGLDIKTGKKSSVINNITLSDSGAIEAGRDLGILGLQTGKDAFSGSLEVLAGALDGSQRTSREALGIASDASAAGVADSLKGVMLVIGLAIAAGAAVLIFRKAV